MKKILIIAVALFYLGLNIGLGMRVHYCGGEPVGLEIMPTEPKKGCCGKEGYEKNCCSDITTYATPINEQLSEINELPSLKFIAIYCYQLFISNTPNVTNNELVAFVDIRSSKKHNPPNRTELCVYRL